MKLLLSVCALLTPSALVHAQSFQYSDFASTGGLALNEDATTSGSTLRLTASALSERGSVYFDQPVVVAGGFETTFTFQITQLVSQGGDGLTFIVQNDPDGLTAIGNHASGIGYGAFMGSPAGTAIGNSLVVEFDTFLGSQWGDLSSNEVSIHTGGSGDNSQDEAFSIASGVANNDMSDGSVHTARIRYVPGMIEVFVDDLNTPLLSAAYSLTTGGTHLNGAGVGGLNLMGGDSAFVGFTASNGGSYENHDILMWDFGPPSGLNATPYCLSLPNSSGNTASITAAGASSITAATLALTASGLPPNVNGIFYYGTGQASVPFGNGFRCINGAVQRLPFNTANAQGVMTQANVFAVPTPNLPITPGSLNFQAWFRDAPGGGAGFNLSDGIEIAFLP